MLKRKNWNQWFAGLVDADGCLLISKQGYASLEITMGIKDEEALYEIKHKLGGYVKSRPGIKAFRYRLHNLKGIKNVINRINGLCRNSVRIKQLKHLCYYFNIPFKKPEILNLNSAWFAGFFDGDGTIGYSFKNNWPQLIISISNKNIEDCKPFENNFGGTIRLDKASNVYKWEIYSKKEIINFIIYIQKYPLKSVKAHRIKLVYEFLTLRQIRAYKKTSEKTYKLWVQLEKKWTSTL